MQTIYIKSPAKINIGLNVIRKRDDGFHDIETIFYPINLFDELTFEKSDTFQFTSNNTDLEHDKNNLIIKAKDLLESYTGKKLKTKISLDKHIPVGAGLGGGSSNCATTLLSLNELFNLKIEIDDLKKLALQLGSDVPFFLNPKPSLASSRGEILKVIELKINFPILIVNPGIHISTKWAFDNLKIVTQQFSIDKLFFESYFSFETLKEKVTNDFENIVFNHYPEIANLKSKMFELGAIFSLMTGTGSTVFGIFKNINDAVKAKSKFNQYFSAIHYEEN